MKNSVKFLLAVSPFLLLQQNANAQNDLRVDFNIRLDEQQTLSAAKSAKEKSIEQIVQSMLKYNNIYGDSKSEIQILQDGASLDLNCFNCIIQSVGPESYEHSPDNKEVFVP
jgi:hypothetical protein